MRFIAAMSMVSWSGVLIKRLVTKSKTKSKLEIFVISRTNFDTVYNSKE